MGQPWGDEWKLEKEEDDCVLGDEGLFEQPYVFQDAGSEPEELEL
jgi:hypothetical protein